MMPYNPTQPRCVICDRRCRNQADLIAHQLEHQESANVMAERLRNAAAVGLMQEAES